MIQVYSKNYFSLVKFILLLFIMAANQTECFRLELRSVIKVLVDKKCKPCERMYDEYGKACLSQKMFTNGPNMGLTLGVPVEKTVHGVETHWHSGKEKIPGAVVCKKKSHAGNVLRHGKTHHYWFHWKRLLGLFYTMRLGNPVQCTLVFTFLCSCFLRVFFLFFILSFFCWRS